MNRKLVIHGHRGCRGLMPENTIPAFIKAFEIGVDALELDVVITKENQVLVSHEPWMSSAICLDANGKNIPQEEERELNIYEMYVDDIKKYDCGIKPVSRFRKQQKIKAVKPLLKEVFEAIENHPLNSIRNPVHYNIEIKSIPDGDTVFHPSPEIFTDQVAEVVIQYNLISRINLQSFDKRILRYCYKTYPEIKLALLMETDESIQQYLKEINFVPAICSPHKRLVTDELIDFCKKENMLIIPWTVNEEMEMIQLVQQGVDGLITDYPDLAMRLFK